MTDNNNNELLHSSLVRWIEQNGGAIHKNLALHAPTDQFTTHNYYTHRGIFALYGPIVKGEELIRIPAALALDGSELPVTYQHHYEDVKQSRNASNWLRCVSSFMHALYQFEKNGDAKHSRSVAVAAKATAAEATNITDNSTAEGQSSQSRVDYSPYIASLPKEYDSLLNWTTWEIRSFLAGTALGVNALHTDMDESVTESTNEITESRHDAALRLRYRKTVIPYLKHLQRLKLFESDESGSNNNQNSKMNPNERDATPKRQRRMGETIFEGLYPLFREGCMCISTRAFHMQLNDSKAETDTTSSGYHGPYLLPYIDLLNHSPQSSPKHVTTLRRDPTDGSFFMIAERDIAIGEEICHSYDVGDTIVDARQNISSSFSSAQMLQTFGFVDVDLCGRRIIDFFLADEDKCNDNALPNPTEVVVSLGSSITPAVLTKSEICKACKELSPSYISELRKLMETSGMLDEGWQYWDIPYSLNKDDDSRSKALNNLPDELLVSSEDSLTDELITICCLNFLPDDTLNELLLDDEETFLLNTEVLEDFFLGKLVLQTIIDVVKLKLKSYKVQVKCSDFPRDDSSVAAMTDAYNVNEKNLDKLSLCFGENEVSDARALSKLIDWNSKRHPGVDKFIYGLVISLEERACLIELRKKACDVIVQI